MKYVWTHHAASDRLPKRSGLTQTQVEDRLKERRYVVHFKTDPAEHHLIYDEVKGCLIDVPVCKDGAIPSIKPVDYGSPYAEWQVAEAERAWRGKAFYKNGSKPEGRRLVTAEVVLAKQWFTHSGWGRHEELAPLLSWFVCDKDAAQVGEKGVLALFRDYQFCLAVKNLILQWQDEIPALVGGCTPALHIKKYGAHRLVPLKFFFRTP